MPGFLATLCVSPADGVGGITLANATSGPDIAGIAIDLVSIVADNEPRLPDRWKPLPEVDQALLALTGLWYWGPRAYALRLVADRGLELGPATRPGPCLPLPRRARRHLDRARRLLHRRDPPPGPRPRWHGGPP